MRNRLLAVAALFSCLVITGADAQRLQPGQVRLTIGSWKGTAEIDAFTRKERLILTSGRSDGDLLLRCLDGNLSIGWVAGGFAGKYNAGDDGELNLRIGDEILGPFKVSALNKFLVVAPLTVATLDKIAKANKEIGYKIMVEGIGTTGGVGAIKTAEVAARLKRSCSGEGTISTGNKEKIAPSGEGKVEEKAD
jgi:hypothetical protein